MAKNKKSVTGRKGVALSLLYEYKGQLYRHVFTTKNSVDMRDGCVTIKGDFSANATHGITDN